jgi:hypothetical protein
MALMGLLAGCGGDSATVEEGPKGFTPTDTTAYKSMIEDMQGVQKSKAYTKRPVPTEKDKKEAEKKK